MKIGIISDIHSNLYGLISVIAKLQSCDLILCAGDITGYYTFINEIFDVLEDNNIIFIRGNHDEYLLQNSPDRSNVILKKSVEYTKRMITKKNLSKIQKAPTFFNKELNGIKIKMYHGSPWNFLEEYIYPDYKHFEKFQDLDADLIILGHTHVPFINYVNEMIIFNPGSSGQPRDKDDRASYGVFQTEDRSLEIKRVEYDINRVIQAAKAAGIDSQIIHMLERNY
jgi:putative phosphoesterase